jgi:hypothetical protein
MIDKIQKEEFPSDYKPFLQDILTKIQSTRYEMPMFPVADYLAPEYIRQRII